MLDLPEQIPSNNAYCKDTKKAENQFVHYRHAECHPGDTIVTSGYSAIFPEGLMVGVVEDIEDSHDGLSYLLKVRLSADFGRVRDVRVIARKGMDEFKTLTTTNE